MWKHQVEVCRQMQILNFDVPDLLDRSRRNDVAMGIEALMLYPSDPNSAYRWRCNRDADNHIRFRKKYPWVRIAEPSEWQWPELLRQAAPMPLLSSFPQYLIGLSVGDAVLEANKAFKDFPPASKCVVDWANIRARYHFPMKAKQQQQQRLAPKDASQYFSGLGDSDWQHRAWKDLRSVSHLWAAHLTMYRASTATIEFLCEPDSVEEFLYNAECIRMLGEQTTIGNNKKLLESDNTMKVSDPVHRHLFNMFARKGEPIPSL
jgi:hypothetical protein